MLRWLKYGQGCSNKMAPRHHAAWRINVVPEPRTLDQSHVVLQPSLDHFPDLLAALQARHTLLTTCTQTQARMFDSLLH